MAATTDSTIILETIGAANTPEEYATFLKEHGIAPKPVNFPGRHAMGGTHICHDCHQPYRGPRNLVSRCYSCWQAWMKVREG